MTMEFAKLVKVNTSGYKRVIVISDLHGNGHLLSRLLSELSFSEDDALFLLGDFIERGRNSLETVRLSMSLCERGNAFALQGNCDTLWDDLACGRYGVDLNAYIDWRKNSILADMCAELDIDRKQLGSKKTCEVLSCSYSDIFAWLRELPHIIEAEDTVFVHAGVDDGDLTRQNAERCVKREAFMEEEHQFTKTVICGHMPLCNYFHLTGDRLSFLPLRDAQKNIVCIDGGNAVKYSGQLNAYVIENNQSSFLYTDDLQTAIVLKGQEASITPSSVAWNHREVKLLQKRIDRSLCLIPFTGKTLEIPNDLLYKENETLCSDDFTDNRLALKPGDAVKLLDMGEKECLVKHDGIIGWVSRTLLT